MHIHSFESLVGRGTMVSAIGAAYVKAGRRLLWLPSDKTGDDVISPPSQYSSTLGHAWSRASTRVSAHAEPHVRGGGCCPVRLRSAWGTRAPAADDAALSQPSWLGGTRSKCWSQAGPGSSGLPCIDVTCQLVNRIPPNEGRAGV